MLPNTLKAHLFCSLAASALLGATAVSTANAAAVRAGFDTFDIGRCDDTCPSAENGGGDTVAASLGFTMNFFGTNYSSLSVNNNGNVTFAGTNTDFTPNDLTGPTSNPIIAPFFADVDTRDPGSSTVTYGTGTVDGRDAFGVNWLDVGYWTMQSDLLNSFQLVIIDRSDLGAGFVDIEFNYDSILWEAGDFSGADGCADGEGDSAYVGYSAGSGDAGTFAQLAGSGTPGALVDEGSSCVLGDNSATALTSNSLNSDVMGRYVFQVRADGVIEEPVEDDSTSENDIPEPTTMALFGVGLLGLGAMRRRSRRG